MTRTIMVSGCFDMLHSGHVEFLQRAAAQGDHLIVALGADQTVFDLKGRLPVCSEEERRFMVQNVACVDQALISQGSGYLDFEPELRSIRPDVFVVNEDGNTPDKRRLVESLGIGYVVLQRTPHSGLVPRSTTDLRRIEQLPYRIDLAGGWLDQPFVSKHHPGSVITISIEPTLEFNERSGMATSTRRTAMRLWGNRFPAGDLHQVAYMLFCCDNPPGTTVISGAQDTVGLVFPGLARSDYAGTYWPHHIEHLADESALRFVEELLYLVPLGPRQDDFDVLSDTCFTPDGARALAEATDDCWQAILDQDAGRFGDSVRRAFDAQIAMFPRMVTPTVLELIDVYRDVAVGWKLSGAGGGGYLVVVADKPVENAVRCYARRALA